jgi:chemotaxis protein CheZ
MNAPENRADEYLDQARELVTLLEAGRVEQADELLAALSGMRESKIFHELGKLTRTLHEAITHFPVDPRLTRLSEKDMPDARERLRYVVTKTEESANRTLKAVEDSIPLAKHLSQRATEHQQQWERFLRREMDVQEFRTLTHSLREFLGGIIADSSSLSSNLSEVLMAQEYQDITGQVIQRVIRVVQDVEDGLVEMVRVVGSRAQPASPAGAQPATTSRLEGPQIDPKKADVMANQDDVDALLSSLGF